MRTISANQVRLLAQAATSASGMISLGERASVAGKGASIAALVHHGLMTVVEAEDGCRSLAITEAGRAALSSRPSPDRTRRKVKRAIRDRSEVAGVEAPDICKEELSEAVPAGPRGRIGLVIRMMSRPEGASLADLMAATGWKAHSLRATASSLRSRLGYRVDHRKGPDGGSYWIGCHP